MSDFVDHPWLKYSAQSLSSDVRTKYFDAEQDGWFINLFNTAWMSNPRGLLSNDAELLRLWAKAKGHGKAFEQRWRKVLAAFERQGKFLVLPQLVAQAKKIKGESKDCSNAGSMGAIARKLKYLPKDDASREHLEAELAKLRGKTARGKSAARAAASAPAPKATGKIKFDGVDYFPSELLRIKTQLLAQIAENKKDKPPAPAGSRAGDERDITYRVRLSEWNEEQRRLKARRDEIDVALGLRPAKAEKAKETPEIQNPAPPPPAPPVQASAPPEKMVPLIFSPEFKAGLLTATTENKSDHVKRRARTAANAGLNPIAKLARQKRKGQTLEQITS